MNKRIVVIGAGRRVKNDVIPSLQSIQFDFNSLLVVRRKNQKLSEFPELKVEIDLNLALNYFKPHIVICCVPITEFQNTYSILKNYEIEYLLVDTPIYINSEVLKSAGKLKNICILEDSVLIPWIDAIRHKFTHSSILLIYQAMYEYHGLALLKAIFDSPIKVITLPKFINRYLILLKINNTFIVWYRKRNYKKGFVVFFKNKQIECLGNNHLVDFQEEFYRALLGDLKNFLDLDCLHRKPFDTSERIRFIRDMHFWKRLGLALGLRSLIYQNSNCFLKLDEMIEIEEFLD